jgi:uncharacterized membrane protein
MSDPLRRWRLATFGALLLAVALGGALATVLLARSHHRHPHAVMTLPGLRVLAGELEPAERAALRTAFRERHPQMRARIDALHAARKGVVDALRAEPFDRARLESALAEVRAQDTAAAAGVHETLVELAVSLDAAGRERLADAVARAPRGHGERRRHRD